MYPFIFIVFPIILAVFTATVMTIASGKLLYGTVKKAELLKEDKYSKYIFKKNRAQLFFLLITLATFTASVALLVVGISFTVSFKVYGRVSLEFTGSSFNIGPIMLYVAIALVAFAITTCIREERNKWLTKKECLSGISEIVDKRCVSASEADKELLTKEIYDLCDSGKSKEEIINEILQRHNIEPRA